MIRLLFSFCLGIVLLSSGCVSKKKYAELDHSLADARMAQASQQAMTDSLMRENVFLRDSLRYLDSLLAYERNRSSRPAPAPPKKSSMSKDDEYAKKALFVFNFTKYVAWPSTMPKSDKFVIGVVGESMLADKLKTHTAGKKAYGLPIEIKTVSATNASACYIVFVPHSMIGSLKTIREKFGKHTLIITEEQSAAYNSSHINMYPDDTRVRYSVNKSMMEKNELKATQDLLRYAD